jgi:plastocyanin
MKKTSPIFSILLLASLVLACSNTYATIYSIDVKNYVFAPSSLTTVKIGDTIHWEWKEGTHTTTSASIPSGASPWDQPITSSSQAFNYIPTKTGTYNYVCTPHASMGMIGSFTVSGSSGVNDPSSPVSLVLYPNPFKEKITFFLQGDEGRSINSVTVYDITGKTMATRSFDEGGNDHIKDIMLSDLSSGVFFFEFRDNKGGIFTRKAVKK